MSELVPTSTETGHRLHPLGLILGFVMQLPQMIVPIVAVLYGARDSSLGLPAVIGLVLVVSLLFKWIAWRRFRYWIGDDEVRIEKGLLSRSARSIPYDRIADVSIEQKPLARLLGLGEVKFETGGGTGDDAVLSFVSMEEATRLRETVRERKAIDQAPTAAQDTVEATAPVLFAMDGRRLLTLGFYSFSLVILAVLIGAAQQFDFLLPFDPWDWERWLGAAANGTSTVAQIDRSAQLLAALAALLGLIAVGFATGIGRTVLREFGFVLERTAKGFRRRRGLLTKTDVTLPIERIQAACIETGPLRQRGGWYALRFVSLANESKAEKDHAMAPLAKLDELWPILREARLHPPGKSARFVQANPGPWIDEGLITAGVLTLAAAVASRFVGPAAWAIPGLILPFAAYSWFDWRNRFHAVDQDQLYVRRGWWNRRLELARQVNVQSVSLTQGPLLRLRGLARIEFGIAGGEMGFSAVPLADAKAIRDQVMALAAPVDFSQLGLHAD